MWNSIYQRHSDLMDMIIKPVAMFENPFLKSPHKLILCDMWKTLEKPAGMFLIGLKVMQYSFASISYVC
jgi:hypothetical protein